MHIQHAGARCAPSETAMAAAFARAGGDLAAPSLVATATEILRRSDLMPRRALWAFRKAVTTDPRLLDAALMICLERMAADMRGESLVGARLGKLGAAGAQSMPARSGQSNDDGAGQNTAAEKARNIVSAPSSPAEASSHHSLVGTGQATRAHEGLFLGARSGQSQAGGGQDKCADQAEARLPSSAPSRDGGGRKHVDLLSDCASVVANPPRRNLATIARVNAGLLEDFKLRDGRAIASLNFGELIPLAEREERIAAGAMRFAQILRRVHGHVANYPAGARVRDLVSEAAFKAILDEVDHG